MHVGPLTLPSPPGEGKKKGNLPRERQRGTLGKERGSSRVKRERIPQRDVLFPEKHSLSGKEDAARGDNTEDWRRERRWRRTRVLLPLLGERVLIYAIR
jgi:hypothetical protein